MAGATITTENIQELRELATGWGQIIARRAVEEYGLDPDEVDFVTMESFAHAAAQGIIQGTLGQLAQRQAQALGPQQPCPTCQRPCLIEFEERPLAVRGGSFLYREPFCHCPACRRDFFPPTHPLAPG